MSQEITLFCEHLKEQPLTTVASQQEEQAFSRFEARMRHRSLKALREGATL